jgi:hypothetical protein
MPSVRAACETFPCAASIALRIIRLSISQSATSSVVRGSGQDEIASGARRPRSISRPARSARRPAEPPAVERVVPRRVPAAARARSVAHHRLLFVELGLDQQRIGPVDGGPGFGGEGAGGAVGG